MTNPPAAAAALAAMKGQGKGAPAGFPWPPPAGDQQGMPLPPQMVEPATKGQGKGPGPQAKGHVHGKGKGCCPGHGAGRELDDDDDEDEEEEDDEDDEEAMLDSEDYRHFAEVCYSLVSYGEDAAGDLGWLEDSLMGVTDPDDRALMLPGLMDLLPEMRRCAEVNARFLAMLVESDEDACHFAKVPDTHQVLERNSMKVRTVLRQFVRDWAEEGKAERDLQYGLLLEALEKHMPLKGSKRRLHVLSPGSGLSRLPFEVAARGYVSQGNEFSYHMLQGSKWVLNETSRAHSHTIYPFLLSMEHRRTSRDQLRAVTIPDVCPSALLSCESHNGEPSFSMCAGEFIEVYAGQRARWDAVLTCFFIDTAKNIFLYIRTIAEIIRPGGLWANLGPLLYHYAEQPNSISIELSWEEVKPEIEKYFVFMEEEAHEAFYTTNIHGLLHTRYRCIFFAARRNDRPAEGYSKPVF